MDDQPQDIYEATYEQPKMEKETLAAELQEAHAETRGLEIQIEVMREKVREPSWKS